jgi:hypothetical protein
MRYKRQILLILYYILVINLILLITGFYFGFFDHMVRIPITQVYSTSSRLVLFVVWFNFFENSTLGLLFLNYPNKLKKKCPAIDASEFDFRKFEKDNFEKRQFNKRLSFVQPIICVMICTPYLYYFLTNHYEFKILFGILANLAIILYLVSIYLETIINRFLFMRHLDNLLNNPT